MVLRRLSTRMLSVVVAAMGVGLAVFSIGNGSGYGHMGVGWTMADNNLIGGLLRLGFSFSCGLLLSRVFRPTCVRGAFWICSIVLLALFTVPHVGGEAALWQKYLRCGLHPFSISGIGLVGCFWKNYGQGLFRSL